ncbi:MAG: hypothetical protein HWE21_06480 [Cytophagia bacterium]|nr:hypothetical protein [Cytophagia bacterium]
MNIPYQDIYHRYQLRELSDPGVSISKIKQLFKFIESDYVEFLERYFKSELESNDSINISGSGLLLNLIVKRESRFPKYDLDCDLQDIRCLDIGPSNKLTIKFSNIQQSALKDVLDDEIIAETIHSAKAEFLEGSFRIKKYADYLYSKGLNEIVLENITKLSQIQSDTQRKYRIIQNENDQYLLRGITSVSGYKNYNIPFSVALTLLALHRTYKNSSEVISISGIYLDDSNLEVTFEKSGQTPLGSIGMAKHHIILANDEIRRRSMSLSGMTSIVYQNEGQQREVYFQAKKEVKSGILSISHGSNPENWIESLPILSELIKTNEENLLNDFRQLDKVKDADQLRFALQNSFKRASKEEIKKYKGTIETILKNQINSIHALLEILSKISLLAQEDLEAREYMRYIFYTKVIERK